MEEKKFSKTFIATLKRTAQNVSPITKRIEKIQQQQASLNEELNLLQKQYDAFQEPIKQITGGYTTDDLIIREKQNNIVSYKLKYPESIIPTELSYTHTTISVEESSTENEPAFY